MYKFKFILMVCVLQFMVGCGDQDTLPNETIQFFEPSKLKEELRKYQNENKEEYAAFEHQMFRSIVNFYYEKDSDDNFSNVPTDQFNNQYGHIPYFIILIENYINQVNNGGHFQYFINGYCTGKSLLSDVSELSEIRSIGAEAMIKTWNEQKEQHDWLYHEKMIDMTKRFNPITENGLKFLGIMKSALKESPQPCDVCNSNEQISLADAVNTINDSDDSCENCFGKKWFVNIGDLDNDFYLCSDDFLGELELFLKKILS